MPPRIPGGVGAAVAPLPPPESAANAVLRAATAERIVEERPPTDPAGGAAAPKDAKAMQMRIHQVRTVLSFDL